MDGHAISVWLPLAACYAAFLAWYRGSGRPLTREEAERHLAPLRERATDAEGRAHLAELERMLEGDDGREFVMQNLIRYRAKAEYPPGSGYGDDPRAADRRYGRAIVPYLLRHGCVPVFVATRCGSFIEPEGIDRWDVVAMVRYRSRRDLLRFAVAITRDRISVHKWAAIENTQVFPVRPLFSLVMVRGAVAAVLLAAGLLLGLA